MNIKKISGAIIVMVGVLLSVVAICAGVYVSVVWCITGGVIQIIQACQVDPVDATMAAWGVGRIIICSAAGGITFLVSAGIASLFIGGGQALWTSGEKRVSHRPRY